MIVKRNYYEDGDINNVLESSRRYGEVIINGFIYYIFLF